jgi:hypothetical protein
MRRFETSGELRAWAVELREVLDESGPEAVARREQGEYLRAIGMAPGEFERMNEQTEREARWPR